MLEDSFNLIYKLYNIYMVLGITTDKFLIDECQRLGIKLNKIDNKDNFKNIKCLDGGYIFNLQNDQEGGGTHWTCAFVKNNKFIYFDSFAGQPPVDIIKFAKNNKKKIYYNLNIIQNLKTDSCGYYCLHFLYFMTKHNTYCKCLRKLMILFTSLYDKNNTQYNQYILENYYNELRKKVIYL